MKNILITLLVLGSLNAFADESTESKLSELSLPSNVAPAIITQEKLYSVQSRYNDLTQKSEVTLGYSNNFKGNSFVNMTEVDLGYRFHFNDLWSIGVSGAYGFNSFTKDSTTLFVDKKILPDAALVKYRGNLTVGRNLFYGKFRLSMDEVLYFDQYITVGPGMITTQYETSPSAVMDIGMAFWTGKRMSFRFGFQNEFYNEKRLTSSGLEHHLLGHLNIGYTFGGVR